MGSVHWLRGDPGSEASAALPQGQRLTTAGSRSHCGQPRQQMREQVWLPQASVFPHTRSQVYDVARDSAEPQATLRMLPPQPHVCATVSLHSSHAPAWHSEGQVWRPQPSGCPQMLPQLVPASAVLQRTVCFSLPQCCVEGGWGGKWMRGEKRRAKKKKKKKKKKKRKERQRERAANGSAESASPQSRPPPNLHMIAQ